MTPATTIALALFGGLIIAACLISYALVEAARILAPMKAAGIEPDQPWPRS